MTDGQPTEKLESDKILDQIDALKSGKTEPEKVEISVESAQSTDSAPKNESEDKTASTKSEQAVSQDEVAPPAKADKENDEIKEWARKKGIKDPDQAYRSLRELERKMHKLTYEEKQKQIVPQGTNPAWQPAPQVQPQYQPQFAPPYPYPDPTYQEKLLEAEAAKRGWDKEDFKKVLDLTIEVSDKKLKQYQQVVEARYAEVEKETRRTSELFELMKDPVFTNEKVQFEMHKVLEENPDAFKYEPSPYQYAFNEAQKRLARKYLQGESGTDEKPSQLPKNPPRDGGTGHPQSFEKSKESQIFDSFSKAKTSDEQREILTRLGAVSTL
jgi:hypothetical protein